MGDVSAAVESGVGRQLQHAILQLCNEHVTYEHTLQVLGVVCVTVDDQPRDVVVKLNNTLKRVDAAVTGDADVDRRVGLVRGAAPTSWPRGGDATPASSCSAAAAAVSTASCGDPPQSRQVRATTTPSSEAAATAASNLRKCHGRKQSNPVRVKPVTEDDNDDDNDDDDDDYEYSTATDYPASGVLMIAPAEPSAGDDDHVTVTSRSSSPPRLLRPVVDEQLLPRRVGRRHAGTPSSDDAGSARALLTGKDDRSQDVVSRRCTSRTALSASTPEPSAYRPSDCVVTGKLRRDSASDVQDSALNFSTRTSKHSAAGISPDCSARNGGVQIKEEMPAHHPPLPLTYGLDLGGGGGTFEMSRSLSVAAALSQYVDDPAILQSLTSYDQQQRLALYTSLMTAAAVSGVPPAAPAEDDRAPASMSLQNGARCRDGGGSDVDLGRPALVMPGYAAMSTAGPLAADGTLNMHRLPSAMRRRNRFDHHPLHHTHQPPMKVHVLGS